MQGRYEHAFQKKLVIWKKHASCRKFANVSQRCTKNHQETLPLIVTHLDALLDSLKKYFPSKSVDQFDWVRNPFVEPCQEQFTLKEKLVSIAGDRTLKLKHAQLNLDEF